MSNESKDKSPLEEFENLPTTIGPYEIKEKINEGEFSKIYLGISKYTNDKVSLKIINKSSFTSNPNNLILIKNEIEVLKILKHRNILTLYEIYESSQYIFLITEYLSSELTDLIINKKRLSETDALKIFIQLIDAFQYMHKLQICHRDFCLEHVMLDSNNIPKIIDFGSSTFYKKGEQLEEPFGSLAYACPEMIKQERYEPELADVWSLGVCLYVMLCGYLPFSDEDDNKIKDLIIAGKVEYPSEIGNICKDLLKKMLEVDTKKRINILKITRHPWIKGCKDFKIIGGYNTYEMVYPIDERLLKLIKEYGIDTTKLENDLQNNKYNNITGLFKLLTKKVLALGFGTISDFTSNAFVEYTKKKDKMLPDGNNKYNEYLTKIEEKKDEIKKIVNSYIAKQEEVIKQLDEMKNNDAKEENDSNKKEEIPPKTENKSIISNKEENPEINEVKNEEIEKEEKSEKNEDNNEEDENKSKKEMRYSLSFDDDEDKEKSDNDDFNNNNEDKNDEEKSKESNEKEISIKEKEEEKELDKKEEKEEKIKEEKEEEKEKINEVENLDKKEDL